MKKPQVVLVLLIVISSFAEAAEVRLDADAAARRAIEVSALVDAAAAHVDAASASVEAADAQRMPFLRVAAVVGQRSSVPELWVNMNGPLEPPVLFYPNIETTGEANIRLDQVIYAGGAIDAGREGSRSNLDGASAERETLLADLVLNARLAYWRAVAARAGLHAAQTQEQRSIRLLDDSRALLDAGMAVRADVLSAEARLAAAQVEVIVRTTETDNEDAALRSLLEIDDDVEIVLGQATGVPPQPADLELLQHTAMERRAELVAVASRTASLTQQERAIDSARKPAVTVGAHWLVARPNMRYFPLEDAWNDSWGVDLRATWTLFDGHRTRAETAVVRHQRQALDFDREELERRIRLEVETARRDLLSALAAVSATTASVEAASAREQAVQERYEAGLAPISDVLDAQTDLADAELSEILAHAAAWMAGARLKRAVGEHVG